ncbi:MAG: hypothetical protein AAF564_22720 [Bacteroidota bacterium]
MTIKDLRITLIAARIYVAFIALTFIAILVITVVRDKSIVDALPGALLVLAVVISIIPTGIDAAKKLKSQAD